MNESRIPGGGTLADAVKARDARQVRADEWATGRVLTATVRAELATWIAQGGIPPWEAPLAVEVYPPAPATTDAQPI